MIYKKHAPLSDIQQRLVDQMMDALLDANLTVRETRQVCSALRTCVERHVSDRPLVCDDVTRIA